MPLSGTEMRTPSPHGEGAIWRAQLFLDTPAAVTVAVVGLAAMKLAWLSLAVVLTAASVSFALPPFPQGLPQDPAVYAEWVCYPLRQVAAFGACGCGFPGACGDRAPAGCYCDDRCVEEGDCCIDAALVCAAELAGASK